MRFFLILLLTFFYLSACQSAKDALTLKKKESGDEFLVEKKNPLVLPPDYSALPTPENINSLNKNENLIENDNNKFEEIIKKPSKIENSEQKVKSSSTEASILENIKKDESN